MYLLRVDCVLIYLWCIIIKVCNFFGNVVIWLWVYVEGRKMLNLLFGYFGNVIGMMIVIIIVKEFWDNLFVFIVKIIYLLVGVIIGEWF